MFYSVSSQHCDFTLSLLFSQFFMLILFIFLAELAAAILAFLFREHVSTVSGSVHEAQGRAVTGKRESDALQTSEQTCCSCFGLRPSVAATQMLKV